MISVLAHRKRDLTHSLQATAQARDKAVMEVPSTI